MAVVVTDQRTLVDEADSLTGWSSPVAGESLTLFSTGPLPREESDSIGMVVSTETSDLVHTLDAATPMTNELIYVWIYAQADLDTYQNGGISITIGDAVDLTAYHVGGSDRAGFRTDTGRVQWQCFIIDTSLTPTEFSTDLQGTEASIDYSNITRIGSAFKTLSKALGNLENCFTDIIRYGNDGIRIEGGTASDPGTFLEIVDEDVSVTTLKAHGVIRTLSSGIYGTQGTLQFGLAAGTQDCYFEDDGIVVAFEDRPIADDKYQFNVEGATAGGGSTYTNSFILSNSTITSAGPEVQCDFAGENIDTIDLDNVSFTSLGRSITFSNFADASGHSVTNSTFFACGQVDPGDVTFTNNSFLDSNTPTTGAMLLDSDGTDNISGLSFTTTLGYGYTGAAIYITSTGTYTFTNFSFTGYGATGSGTAAVYNNSGGEVTIQVSGGTAPTYDNSAGSTTNIISTKTIDFNVEDSDGLKVENAQVYIQKDSPTDFRPGDEYNQEGQTFIVVDQTIDADIPTTGRLTVLDCSENFTFTYRYASIDTDRLNFPAEVTGAADAAGTSTQLFDTGAFGSVQEGDAIRNTTDGSWGVVDQIISANEIRTTALRGGTDNTWADGDGWSINTLATTLEIGRDLIDIPLVNSQTDSNGDITTVNFNFQSTISVDIRIRSNEGTKKYVPFLTSASITGNFAGSAVIQEDPVAT